MVEQERLIELLAAWEEQRQAGKTPTAQELCPDDTALQLRLAQRIEKRLHFLRRIDPPTVAQDTVGLPPPLPQLDGYELYEVLGAGGMGIVYRARQIGLQRTVAVKMVLAGLGGSAGEIARFHTEAKAVAQLHHPHIVQVYDVGTNDGRPFLVLEFVEGGNLAQHLGGAPLAPERAAGILQCLARGVQHAHERGIVHRDLKPANVLLTRDGTPKIADFGLAKRLNDDQGHTRTGMPLGTAAYMAPEQALGRTRQIGPATDVYALGVILYEMLTGRVPFTGATLLETLDQVRTQDPAPPRQLCPRLSRDLDTICLKCLQKEPGHRYPSADAFAADLERYLAGEPIQARPETLLDQITCAVVRRREFPYYAAWGRLFLAITPFPTLVHVVLILLFQSEPYFPLLAIAVSLGTALVTQTVISIGGHAGFQHVPAPFRRHTHVVWGGYFLASGLMLLAVWRFRPADQPDFWLLTYPLSVMMVTIVFFAFAAEIGAFFVTIAVSFVVSLAMIAWPRWAPLLAGLLMSFNTGSFGLLYCYWARELRKADAAADTAADAGPTDGGIK
jgi:serine/threonine protein kinase